MTDTHENQSATTDPRQDERRLRRVVKTLTRRSFCTLATVSPAGRPHVAGVVYETVDTTLYVNTSRSSRKARNIAENPHVAVCVPVRRLPVGPPATAHVQGVAEIVAMDDPEIVRLLEAGQLKAITGHGELDQPDGCFLRIRPARRINTYGVGTSLWRFLRDPLHAGGSVELPGRGGGQP